MLLGGAITPSDVLNTTTLIVLALIALAGNIALAVYDRRSRRREVGVQWEARADELSDQLKASYLERLREITKDRDYWRARCLGRPGADDRQ